MRKFADSIVAKYDTGEELVLVGWSMGGVIACAIAGRFRKSRVQALATIFSPHRYPFTLFPRMLDSGKDWIRSIPVVSFAGTFDVVVPWGAKYPTALMHTKILSDHVLGLIFSHKPAKIITQTVRASVP